MIIAWNEHYRFGIWNSGKCFHFMSTLLSLNSSKHSHKSTTAQIYILLCASLECVNFLDTVFLLLTSILKLPINYCFVLLLHCI